MERIRPSLKDLQSLNLDDFADEGVSKASKTTEQGEVNHKSVPAINAALFKSPLVRDIVERKPRGAVPPGPSRPAKKPSRFSLERARRNGSVDGPSVTALESAPPPTRDQETVGNDEPLNHDDLAQISRGNEEIVSQMSEEQILQEQEDIIRQLKLSDSLVAMLRNRAETKGRTAMQGGEVRTGQARQVGHAREPVKRSYASPPPSTENAPSTGGVQKPITRTTEHAFDTTEGTPEYIRQHFFPQEPLDNPNLEWMRDPVQPKRASQGSHSIYSQLFDANGSRIEHSDTTREPLGGELHAGGGGQFTLGQLLSLAQSQVTPQRAVAYGTLHKVMVRGALPTEIAIEVSALATGTGLRDKSATVVTSALAVLRQALNVLDPAVIVDSGVLDQLDVLLNSSTQYHAPIVQSICLIIRNANSATLLVEHERVLRTLYSLFLLGDDPEFRQRFIELATQLFSISKEICASILKDMALLQSTMIILRERNTLSATVLQMWSAAARYGLGVSMRTTATEELNDLLSLLEELPLNVTNAFIELLSLYTVLAIDPHVTQHDITWTQVTTFYYDALCDVDLSQDTRPALFRFLAAFVTGCKVNEEKSRYDRVKHDVSTKHLADVPTLVAEGSLDSTYSVLLLMKATDTPLPSAVRNKLFAEVSQQVLDTKDNDTAFQVLTMLLEDEVNSDTQLELLFSAMFGLRDGQELLARKLATLVGQNVLQRKDYDASMYDLLFDQFTSPTALLPLIPEEIELTTRLTVPQAKHTSLMHSRWAVSFLGNRSIVLACETEHVLKDALLDGLRIYIAQQKWHPSTDQELLLTLLEIYGVERWRSNSTELYQDPEVRELVLVLVDLFSQTERTTNGELIDGDFYHDILTLFESISMGDVLFTKLALLPGVMYSSNDLKKTLFIEKGHDVLNLMKGVRMEDMSALVANKKVFIPSSSLGSPSSPTSAPIIDRFLDIVEQSLSENGFVALYALCEVTRTLFVSGDSGLSTDAKMFLFSKLLRLRRKNEILSFDVDLYADAIALSQTCPSPFREALVSERMAKLKTVPKKGDGQSL